MSWMIDLTQLDDVQRQLLRSAVESNGPMHIDGPAGTGKSVMLVHCAREHRRLHPNSKIAMVLFTHSLIDMMKAGIGDTEIELMTVHNFERSMQTWDLILVDEIQDVEAHILSQLQSRSKSLLVAGDFNQRIYDFGCDAGKLYHTLRVEQRELAKIYRLTRTIQKAASPFTNSPARFMDYETQDRKDISINLSKFENKKDNFDAVWLAALDDCHDRGEVAILLPRNKDIVDFAQKALHHAGIPPFKINSKYQKGDDYKDINSYLEKSGLPLQIIGKGAGSLVEVYRKKKISLITMHSAKGLDFRSVFIPFLNNKNRLWKDPIIERRLFFVALTRSRSKLHLSYHQQPHPFLEEIDPTLLINREARYERQETENVTDTEDWSF